MFDREKPVKVMDSTKVLFVDPEKFWPVRATRLESGADVRVNVL